MYKKMSISLLLALNIAIATNIPAKAQSISAEELARIESIPSTPRTPLAKFSWGYRFSDFPTTEFKGRRVYPNFSGREKDYKPFRSRIANASRAGPNFARSLTLLTFGCGAECIMGFVVDLKNGRIYDLPVGGEENPMLSTVFKFDSTLLRTRWSQNPMEQNEQCVQAYYRWTGTGFVLLRKGLSKGSCEN